MKSSSKEVASLEVRCIALIIAASPILWLLGLSPFTVHMAAACALAINLASGSWRVVPVLIPFSFYAGLLTIGVLSRLGVGESGRLIGALYNVSIWASGIAVAGGLARVRLRPADIRWLGGAATVLGGVIVALAIVALGGALTGRIPLVIQSPGRALWPEGLLASSTILSASQKMELVRPDFTSFGTIVRTATLFPYPTAMAIGCVALICLTLLWCRSTKRAKIWYVLVLGETFALILTMSRSTMVAFGVASTAVWIVVGLRAGTSKRLTIVFATLVILVCATIVTNGLGRLIDGFLNAREGSFASRMLVYEAAFSSLKPYELVTGMGYKRVVSELSSFPLGSHSTYLGSIVKAGLVGFGSLVVGWVGVLCVALRHFWAIGDRGARTVASSLLVFLLTCVAWQMVDDIDAPALAALLIFTVVGLSINKFSYAPN